MKEAVFNFLKKIGCFFLAMSLLFVAIVYWVWMRVRK